jgi:endoglucanase
MYLRLEMHQYLDSDGSGTSPTCVSSTIGAERLADATTWLQSNGLRGFLGEIGTGSNGAHRGLELTINTPREEPG